MTIKENQLINSRQINDIQLKTMKKQASHWFSMIFIIFWIVCNLSWFPLFFLRLWYHGTTVHWFLLIFIVFVVFHCVPLVCIDFILFFAIDVHWIPLVFHWRLIDFIGFALVFQLFFNCFHLCFICFSLGFIGCSLGVHCFSLVGHWLSFVFPLINFSLAFHRLFSLVVHCLFIGVSLISFDVHEFSLVFFSFSYHGTMVPRYMVPWYPWYHGTMVPWYWKSTNINEN